MKELNTRKIVKRMVAFFLALAMCVNIPIYDAGAADTSTITLTPDQTYDVSPTSKFVTITADVTTGNGLISAGTYYLDGVEKSFSYDSGVCWWGTGGQSIYLYLNNAAATLQAGATSMSELYSHRLTIPAGTNIGSWTLSNTLNFRICEGKMTLLESVVETEMSLDSATLGAGGDVAWIDLKIPGLVSSKYLSETNTAFDYQHSPIYVNGELRTDGMYYLSEVPVTDNTVINLGVYGITQGETNYVTIKKGTLIQDLYVTKDLNLRINPDNTVDELVTVTPKWLKNDVADDGYRNIYYTFDGAYDAHPLSYESGTAKLVLGDKRVNCEWSKYESDGTYGVYFRVRENFLPNAGVVILEEGASIGNCQVGEAVYAQFSDTDTVDYGTELIAVDNTLSGVTGSASLYYFTINNLTDVATRYDSGNRSISLQVQDGDKVSKYTVNATIHPTNVGAHGIWPFFSPTSIGYTSSEDINNVSVTIPAGTVFLDYYFKNSVGVTLNGATATDMGDIAEPEITEVQDVDLPAAIVVPTNDRKNETRTVYSNTWTEFYFKATESDPLPINNYGTTKYSFTTGGLYLNGAEDPMSIGGFRKLEDKQYYIEVGRSELLKAGDTVTLKGTVKVGDICVAFQETKFYVDENSHIALWEHDPASPYESTLDDVYVDLGDLGDDVYAIPEANSITVDGTPIDATTTEGRTLSTAGDYAVVREDGYVTYKQNVICYEIGDANADGDLNVVDLIAAKNTAEHTKKAEVKGADITNDNSVNADDLAVMRELLVGNTDTSAAREKYQELVFGVISDTHILGDTGEPANVPILQRREKFKKALTYYKSNNAKLIIINGDVSEFGTAGSYEMINNLIAEVYPEGEDKPQFVFTADNHEYWEAWGPEEAKRSTYDACKQKFMNGLGLGDVNNHYVVGGYDFISISSDDKTGSYAIYDQATIGYLETELAAAAAKDADKPIFVAIHQPEHTTVDSSVELYNKLRAYPQVVLFTSHTHYLLNDERSIVQDEFTTVNTAATHYAWVREAYTNFEEDTTPSGYNFAQGLLVRVKGNTTEIDRYDIYNDQPIGVTWTITTSDCAEGGTKTYTDAARQTAASAPTFAENTEVTADWVTLTSCTLTFAQATPATQSDFVYRYKIVVKDSTGAQVASYSYLNDFWHKYMPETVTFTIPDLDCYESYSFEIKAEETYGNSSNGIQGTILSVIESQSNS